MSLLTRLSAKFAEVPGNGSHVQPRFLSSSVEKVGLSGRPLEGGRERTLGAKLSRAMKMAS